MYKFLSALKIIMIRQLGQLAPYVMSGYVLERTVECVSSGNLVGVTVLGTLGLYVLGRQLYRDRNSIRSFLEWACPF